MIYDGQMDKECVPLCDALNFIPGIKTSGSCCGHGTRSFGIWFDSEGVRNLYVITRVIDIRYGGFCNWRCQVEDTDLCSQPVIFFLNSGDVFGVEAYMQSYKLAEAIYDVLGNEKVMVMFGGEK